MSGHNNFLVKQEKTTFAPLLRAAWKCIGIRNNSKEILFVSNLNKVNL